MTATIDKKTLDSRREELLVEIAVVEPRLAAVTHRLNDARAELGLGRGRAGDVAQLVSERDGLERKLTDMRGELDGLRRQHSKVRVAEAHRNVTEAVAKVPGVHERKLKRVRRVCDLLVELQMELEAATADARQEAALRPAGADVSLIDPTMTWPTFPVPGAGALTEYLGVMAKAVRSPSDDLLRRSRGHLERALRDQPDPKEASRELTKRLLDIQARADAALRRAEEGR